MDEDLVRPRPKAYAGDDVQGCNTYKDPRGLELLGPIQKLMKLLARGAMTVVRLQLMAFKALSPAFMSVRADA